MVSLRADVQRKTETEIERRRGMCQLAHRIMHLFDKTQSTTKEVIGNYLVLLQEQFLNLSTNDE